MFNCDRNIHKNINNIATGYEYGNHVCNKAEAKYVNHQPNNLCKRLKAMRGSSQMLERILDISSTLVKILSVCGIHERKANKALDVIIYAFMHFDEIAEHPGGKCKKRIRKEEFYNDLMRDCCMTKAEAKLTYTIVKYGFKAFYHKQVINRYDASFVDECEWRNAANKTIKLFAESGASKSELEIARKRILCSYENYVCRLLTKREERNVEDMDESKCICNHNAKQTGTFNNTDEYLPICDGFNARNLPEPPLCGEFSCQIMCPPGSNRPYVACKDSCGRTFLKVVGNKINFDPFMLESEARRAAVNVCPTTEADRIRMLRECLDICSPPKEIDSCDEKLAEICRDADKSDICDDDDELDSDYGDEDQQDKKSRSSKYSEEQEDKKRKFSSTSTRKDYDDDRNERKETRERDKDEGKGRSKDKDEGMDKDKDRDRRRHSEKTIPDTSTEKETRRDTTRDIQRQENKIQEIAVSMSIKTESSNDGHNLVLTMNGYCPNDGHIPKDVIGLRIFCNKNQILEFSCTALNKKSVGIEKLPQATRQSSLFAQDKNVAMSVAVSFENNDYGHILEIDMKGYCPDNGYVPEDITLLRVLVNQEPPIDFACTRLHYSSEAKGKDIKKQSSREKSVTSLKSSKNTEETEAKVNEEEKPKASRDNEGNVENTENTTEVVATEEKE